MTEEDNQPREKPDARTYFAAERTLLAWVRTGLAMMGFGFVVARFGLFLRELAAISDKQPVPHQGLSLWIGTLLVVFGVAVCIAAAINNFRIVQQLQRGEPLRFSPWSMGVIVAILLSVVGLLMAMNLSFGLVR